MTQKADHQQLSTESSCETDNTQTPSQIPSLNSPDHTTFLENAQPASDQPAVTGCNRAHQHNQSCPLALVRCTCGWSEHEAYIRQEEVFRLQDQLALLQHHLATVTAQYQALNQYVATTQRTTNLLSELKTGLDQQTDILAELGSHEDNDDDGDISTDHLITTMHEDDPIQKHSFDVATIGISREELDKSTQSALRQIRRETVIKWYNQHKDRVDEEKEQYNKQQEQFNQQLQRQEQLFCQQQEQFQQQLQQQQDQFQQELLQRLEEQYQHVQREQQLNKARHHRPLVKSQLLQTPGSIIKAPSSTYKSTDLNMSISSNRLQAQPGTPSRRPAPVPPLTPQSGAFSTSHASSRQIISSYMQFGSHQTPTRRQIGGNSTPIAKPAAALNDTPHRQSISTPRCNFTPTKNLTLTPTQQRLYASSRVPESSNAKLNGPIPATPVQQRPQARVFASQPAPLRSSIGSSLPSSRLQLPAAKRSAASTKHTDLSRTDQQQKPIRPRRLASDSLLTPSASARALKTAVKSNVESRRNLSHPPGSNGSNQRTSAITTKIAQRVTHDDMNPFNLDDDYDDDDDTAAPAKLSGCPTASEPSRLPRLPPDLSNCDAQLVPIISNKDLTAQLSGAAEFYSFDTPSSSFQEHQRQQWMMAMTGISPRAPSRQSGEPSLLVPRHTTNTTSEVGAASSKLINCLERPQSQTAADIQRPRSRDDVVATTAGADAIAVVGAVAESFDWNEHEEQSDKYLETASIPVPSQSCRYSLCSGQILSVTPVTQQYSTNGTISPSPHSFRSSFQPAVTPTKRLFAEILQDHDDDLSLLSSD